MIPEDKLRSEVGRLLAILYAKRFSRLESLHLRNLINKNPYLYRSIGLSNPHDFIEQLLVAFVSSSDETIFGNDFLEPLALWSARESTDHSGGDRIVTVGSGAGQDIAIETATAYLAVSVKSGKNIFNSQSNKGQSTEFNELQARLKKVNKQFRAIIGYGYGRKQNRKQTAVEKVAGQVFWELLTGEEDYYLRIAQAIASFSEKHGDEYKTAFEKKRNKLLRQFLLNFVDEQGSVMWDAIVSFNSAKTSPPRLEVPPESPQQNEVSD